MTSRLSERRPFGQSRAQGISKEEIRWRLFARGSHGKTTNHVPSIQVRHCRAVRRYFTQELGAKEEKMRDIAHMGMSLRCRVTHLSAG